MSWVVSGSELPMTDDDLVFRARTDRAALGSLYDRYYSIVWRYCSRRLFERTVAEDIVSDVFLTVASKLRDFPGKSATDFRRWLFRIASNAVNAHLRQSLHRSRLWEAAASARAAAGNDQATGSASEWESLDWPSVYQAILELEEREQTILTLRFFAGSGHEEIAAVLETTPGAVRTTLCRTLARLREKFNPGAPVDSAARKP
jgi:RNA polymerase sigma-70 factor, ECF subfamily